MLKRAESNFNGPLILNLTNVSGEHPVAHLLFGVLRDNFVQKFVLFVVFEVAHLVSLLLKFERIISALHIV